LSRLAFFDTNVLLYADDTRYPDKQRAAIELFTAHQRAGEAVISIQVLQEYFNGATRRLGIDGAKAQRKVELLARCRVVRLGAADMISAIELHRLGGISFWDSLIVHAARLAGAAVLYSEDMQHGSTTGGVRIANPFG
jgi:predicted nucleic acid-binding protein